MSNNQLLLLAKDNAYSNENHWTNDDGSIMFKLGAGDVFTCDLPFSLLRSSDPGVGVQINSLDVIYRVISGTLTSIVPSLTVVTHTHLANQTNTARALTAGTFILVPNGTVTNFNRIANAVTTPVLDNQSSTTAVSYFARLVFTATTASQVEFHGVNIVTLETAGTSDTSSRVALSEYFEQAADLNANVANATANKNFEVTGTNATASAHSVNGGITLTTAGADNDQAILHPHLDAGQTSWTETEWGTENQLDWSCVVTTPADIANVLVWAGLKLTSDPTIATDDDQVFLRFDTDAADTNWQVVDSIAGTDTTTDSGVAMVASTTFSLRISLDSSRIARVYINNNLVRTTSALTNAVNLIPYIGVQSLSAAADALTVHKTALSRAL